MDDQQIVLYLLICTLIMLVLALSFLWFLNHAQKKITRSRLKEQELKMEYQQSLLLNTVKTKENERSRIAAELHDEVSSQLGIINLNLHVLKKRISPEPQLIELIDQMDVSLKTSTDRTRAISHQLMPPMFKKFGIHHSLQDLQYQINLSRELTLTIEGDYLIAIKDEFKLLHIYRIVQELVNNTMKYAAAKVIALSFEAEQNHIVMKYTDDGVGYDVDNVTTGLGISNINTRVALLMGEIEIKSSVGNGFQSVIKFPNHD